MLRFLFCLDLTVVDHPYRMHNHPDHLDTAFFYSTKTRFAFHFCAFEKNFVIWCVAHFSSMVDLTCLSPWAPHLLRSLFPSTTRTRSTLGTPRTPPRTPSTSRTSPRSLSRQAAPSRITLAWRPAEWRKPSHNNFHIYSTGLVCVPDDCRNSWMLSQDYLVVMDEQLVQFLPKLK